MGAIYRITLAMGVLILGLTGVNLAQSATIDFDFYYPSYDEIVQFVDDIAADPNEPPIVSSYDLGLADDGRQIRAIKISDNTNWPEDEPGFLFIGNIHGDEPLGVRVVLELIEFLTENYGTDPDVTNWVDAYEIWIIPVLNPYGYDNSERKNGPNTGDVNTSGVDLNRNFDFRWDDPNYFEGLPDERTFAGPSAGSEPETVALSDFVQMQRPDFGVTFHSGSGDAPGKLMYPWTLRNDVSVLPPDVERLESIADVIRHASRNTDPPTTDTAAAIGQSNVYNYAITGMFDYMLETGDIRFSRDDQTDSSYNNIDPSLPQPPYDFDFLYDVSLVDFDSFVSEDQLELFEDAETYVGEYLEGLKGLLRYFLFATEPRFAFTGPGLTGKVFDCHTSLPMTAMVKVIELDDLNGDGSVDESDRDIDGDSYANIRFRTSDPLFGRYRRLLPERQQTWTLHFSYPGYFDFEYPIEVPYDPAGVAFQEFNVYLDAGPRMDSDADGLWDCEELNYRTDPDDPDTDRDGLRDGDELLVFETNPLHWDSDGDLLGDGDEFTYGCNPLNPDTDGDGLGDGEEVNTYGTDPTEIDTDGDSLNDYEEVNIYNTEPLLVDTDGDGLTDYEEVITYNTYPRVVDTDGDGLTDYEEVKVYLTNPRVGDTDEDGLTDKQEVDLPGMDPLNFDSDGDGIPDGSEPVLVADVIANLSRDDFQGSASSGLKVAALKILRDVEKNIAAGRINVAIALLENLRIHVDGCKSCDGTPDSDDWIIDCCDQVEIREWIDLVIANLGG